MSRGRIVMMMSAGMITTILITSAIGRDATEAFVQGVSVAVGIGAGGAFLSWRLRRQQQERSDRPDGSA